MPLNRPALDLGPGPSGASRARTWVAEVCRDAGRPDLVECAEMGVSELVTNALLHGDEPITVRVRGTREHPRIEVGDASCEPPEMPGAATLGDEDEVLLTFGRGLDIVSRCSDAWGVEIEEDGKVVWFSPAAAMREDGGAVGVVTGDPDPSVDRESATDLIQVEVLDVPMRAFVDFQNHYRELRREVRLLALAHHGEYPLAQDLTQMFATLDRVLREGIDRRQRDAVLHAGEEQADLVVVTSRAVAGRIGRFLELLDLADEFCRQERLLSLARSPEQRAFQQWFLGEFVRQHAGEEPQPWPHHVTCPECQRVP
ncbi:ATP-binding protein [Nocardioides sp. GCM10027113]|uniref:ATP-binding protein n=1 Tax=unclassified Nocardioides TaxID=2615069 RepID=UPI00361B02F6